MSAIQVTLLVFVLIEILSIMELYFMQDRCVFNGASVFSGWEISKEVPEVHGMVRYLVNWVAGMKLIVVGLLSVLVFTAPAQILLYCAIAMVAAISSFFWRLYPQIRKYDQAGLVEPQGRSKKLGIMVLGLELILITSIVIEWAGISIIS